MMKLDITLAKIRRSVLWSKISKLELWNNNLFLQLCSIANSYVQKCPIFMGGGGTIKMLWIGHPQGSKRLKSRFFPSLAAIDLHWQQLQESKYGNPCCQILKKKGTAVQKNWSIHQIIKWPFM